MKDQLSLLDQGNQSVDQKTVARRQEEISRRYFLKQAAFVAAALACPFPVLADPYAPQTDAPVAVAPVRIRGRVMAGARGVSRVAVTCGLTVVATDRDGRFELVTSTRQPFVSLSVPDGYAIPKSATGTARFYQRIQPNRAGEMEVRFDLVPAPASDRHAFLVLADTQTQNTYETGLLHAETTPDVQETVRSLGDRPVFGLTCGDIMFDDLSLYPEYERAVALIGIPFYQVIGNHDLDHEPSDDSSAQTFGSHFGPTYYSFDRGAVHYVVLDNVFWHGTGYIGYLTGAQLNWLAQDLARVEKGRTIVVFNHIPTFTSRHIREGGTPSISNTTTNREQLYHLLEPYKAHLISGHTHEHEHVLEGGVHEHVTGAVCGAWWSGPICWDGTPNGYGVYEVNGSDLRWRYKATGKEAAYQMRVYPRGSDPKAPDDIVVNVWDADPEWTVVWYEDGMRKGPMSRRTGTDPLSEKLHRGAALPERRPWVDPVPTNHLFYAPVSATAKSVKIEATDRFGRVYYEK